MPHQSGHVAEIRQIAEELERRFGAQVAQTIVIEDKGRFWGMLASRLLKRARALTNEKPGQAPQAVTFLMDMIRAGRIALPARKEPTPENILRYWQTWLTGNSNPRECSALEYWYREWHLERKLAEERREAEQIAHLLTQMLESHHA